MNNKIFNSKTYCEILRSDVLSIVNENLGEIESTLSDIMIRCNLDSFTSVETIKMWMVDLEKYQEKVEKKSQ